MWVVTSIDGAIMYVQYLFMYDHMHPGHIHVFIWMGNILLSQKRMFKVLFILAHLRW